MSEHINWTCTRCHKLVSYSVEDCKALRTQVSDGREWIIITCECGTTRAYKPGDPNYQLLRAAVPVTHISVPRAEKP